MEYFIGNNKYKEILSSTVEDCLSYFKDKDSVQVDTETTGRDCHTDKIVSLQLGDTENQYFIDVRDIDILLFKDLLESKLCILHNAKFDYKFLKKEGIVLNKIYDTMLAECVLYCGYENWGYGLAALSKRYLDIELNKEERESFLRFKDSIFTVNQVLYGLKDVKYLHLIKEKQEELLKQYDLMYCINLENEVVKSLADMEFNGMILDTKEWLSVNSTYKKIKKSMEDALDLVVLSEPSLKHFIPSSIQTSLFESVSVKPNINYSSPQQIAKLFEALGYKVDSTDERMLKKLKNKHIFFEKLLELRKTNKIVSTYGEKFLKYINSTTGKVHTNFWQIVDTGRVSSGNKDDNAPNLQNLPAKNEFRNCFKSREGFSWISIDFSGQELAIMADGSGEKGFIDILNAGEDLHSYAGSMMFKRKITKADKELRNKAKCIHPESLIVTEKGITRIGELSTNRLKDTFSASLCDKVLVGSELIPIKEFYSNGKDIRRAIISKRNIIICSNNHQILTKNGLKKAESIDINTELVLENLSIIEQHPLIISYNPFSDLTTNIFNICLDEKWAYFAGLFLGDGCYNKKCLVISAGDVYPEWQDTIINFIKELGISLKRSGKNSLSCGSTLFVNLLEKINLISNTGKIFRIPEWCFRNEDLALAFLGGLIDTDGTINKKGTVSITTKDLLLAQDLTVLLQILDFNYSIEVSYNKTYNKNYYRIHILSSSLTKLYEANVLKSYKQDQLFERLRIKSNKTTFTKTNKVISNEVHSFGELVDISVDSQEHLYNVNGLVTHNTINFGKPYGMGPEKLADTLGITVEEANQLFKEYAEAFPTLNSWLEDLGKFAKKNEYSLTFAPCKRRRWYPDIKEAKRLRKIVKFGDKATWKKILITEGQTERNGMNSPIQGTGADITKESLVLVRELVLEYNKKYNQEVAFLICTVHDAIDVEVRDDLALQFSKEMEQIMMKCASKYVKKVQIGVDTTITKMWCK